MAIRLLVLMVTTDCNLRCRYCYARGGESPRYMPWEVARSALHAATALAGKSRIKVQLAGGEPTMHMGLVGQVADHLSGHAALQLQTNATLVDRDIAMRLASLDVAVGVSLDGPPSVNDALRPLADGSGSTAAVLTGIEQLRRAGLSVGMTCVLTALSVATLPLLVEMAAYLGNVKGISLDPLRPLGRASACGVASAHPTDTHHWVQETLRRSDALAAMGGTVVRLREFERLRHAHELGVARHDHCYFDAGESLAVTPDGDCYPCASLASLPEFRLGNVMDDDFVHAFPSRLRQARRLIEQPERCLACADRQLCGGGCPANLYAQGPTGQLTECSIKRACLAHLRAKQVSVPQ